MKSLGKLGRKLTMHKSDGKEKRDHQPSAHLDELAQASKDMQDMRNCYDSLLFAAAATANGIFEFSESLHEMGACLLDKTTVDADGESGRVLSILGNMQSELQKIADTYRSYVNLTITNPSESLLCELRKVEEMKLQCDEKREAYKYMMDQHKERGRLRSGKVESPIAQKLQEAQDEYDEVARLCVFRVKSLKEGQCRSLLTQATRHHAAQLSFFRKGLKALEAVDPCIRGVAEKHRIDYQLSGLDDGEGEGMSSYESTEDGELSFDYTRKKQGVDNVGISSNPMELDQVDNVYPQASMLEDPEMNLQPLGRQSRANSFSAPLYPEKTGASARPRETQAPPKFNSYVLPRPASPTSRTPTSVAHSNPFQKSQPVDHERQERDVGNSNTSARPMVKDSNGINSASQLPAPFSFPQRDAGKVAKIQSHSGPLPPSKPFSGKMASTSGPINATEAPHLPLRSVSPPPLSSPRISELHELPRPPKPAVSSGGLMGHSAPLFHKSPPPNSRSAASPLPPPPLVVPRSFSIPSASRARVLHVAKPEAGASASPPLTPILLSNIKSLSTVSEVASESSHN